ncbi:hypothetical protein DNTS_001223 [Danionella cerebrum]|uniref:C2H2-type domain-containing protein n=1 Tax=Danionella cerebrum TaxID=2873325 RepID=A0A553Q455_9TELE|nr:hypothetical protein DNTS_001223 [Danionella translucida]
MSDVVHSFQSQLSGVMETVFKAAIFEITRLVEDSFVKEVTISREQLETLKKRLQASESKRKIQERRIRRLTHECEKARELNEQRREKSPQPENEHGLKQEAVPDGKWKSCELGTNAPLENEQPADHNVSHQSTQSIGREDSTLDCVLKEEAVYAAGGTKELHDGWTLETGGAETSDFSAHTYSEQELQAIQDEWSSGLDQTTDGEAYANMGDVQGLPYRTRYSTEEMVSYSVQELDMGDLDGLRDKTEDAFHHAASVTVRSVQNDLGLAEDGGSHSSSMKKGSLPIHGNPEMEECLLINADGHLQDMSVLAADHTTGVGHRGHSLYDKHSGLSFKENALSQTLKANAEVGSSKASAKGGYICNQCGKKFTQACNLKVHQRVHQREGLHLCSHCGKGYTSFSDLRKHQCSQSGDKPYSCALCGNKFSRLWNLKLHQRIHTQEKPHKCTLCTKSFTRADILKVHQRTHTGERPYCCVICGLTFKRMDHLRSHQRKHSDNKPLDRIIFRMSDTLVITFQTRLSAVMETVLKTTMYEVTRLVEESFLEHLDRGKREAEMLRRRLISSEAKLRERERFKRVRCVDCGRTAVSRRRMLLRGSETHSNLNNQNDVKQENPPNSSWRGSSNGTTCQEKPAGLLETNQNAEPQPAAEVKEEAKELRDTQACLIIHRKNNLPSNSEESNGIRSVDSHKQGVTSCAERLEEEEVGRQRKPLKWFDANTVAVPQPEPSRTSVSSQIGSRDSGTIKQEVVVVLPADWEEMERASAKKTLDHQSAQVSFPVSPIKMQSIPPAPVQSLRSPVRKNTKLVLHPNAVVTSQGAVNLNQAPKTSQTQQPEGVAEGGLNSGQPDRSMPQMLNLRVHGDIRQHSGRTAHNCSQCGKGFSHLCHLRAHQQIHSGDRQFCCSLCGRSFTKLSNLKAHRRVHTGERPYICTDCGKRFTQKCNLKRHQRIHSEVSHSSV